MTYDRLMIWERTGLGICELVVLLKIQEIAYNYMELDAKLTISQIKTGSKLYSVQKTIYKSLWYK